MVDQNYLDARGTGWEASRWASLRDGALSRPLYSSTSQGYAAIRQMLADGLADPYCRFITAAELEGMKKYDVTGVGLNLGTADEYERKTGRKLPPGVDRGAPGRATRGGDGI